MAKHGQHPVGDQIHRRLVSGNQQQIAGRDNLFLGELIAGLLDGNQPRHQVVARVCATLLQQVSQISAQPQAGLHPLLEPLRLAGERDERVEALCEQG